MFYAPDDRYRIDGERGLLAQRVCGLVAIPSREPAYHRAPPASLYLNYD